MMRITFVTSNEHKACEATAILHDVCIVEHVALEIPEMRSDSISDIAAGKAAYAYSVLKRPVITDDTGFFIPALNGFPGPCAAYVHKTIGNSGILNLLAGYKNRRAWFETGIAYHDEKCQNVFTGRIEGKIVLPRGCNGFGYDPIFETNGQTLAEMDAEEKNIISHRALGLHLLRDWLLSQAEEPDA
jgi:XTP/dITP diphosphohydrolase